ncbi:hypothetical protein [Streptomyces ipomoeae]|uniref:hypothetical protein n=1 Tax=Streptomyces ipomoeae TaxID=103232 RepID=UPI0029B0D8A5|nr:hypothetical protein [Streptomyces ipomoeae]MDX2697122.1 hypothetical protein [Streptomyces ipomoeae]
MTTQYRVTYKILPAGVGPDDYEPANLQDGEAIVELSDPEPAGLVIGGEQQHYGPPRHEVEKAVIAAANLAEGDEPIIRSVEQI